MSLRVMLVEDEAAIAATYERALRQAGHEVVLAASGEEALLHRGCDVVVTDLGLPGIDGLDLLQALRSRGEHPRTVVVTGHSDLESCQRALRLGADEFLTKPLSLETLVEAVEQRPPVWTPQESVYERTYKAIPDSVECAARDLAAHALRNAISPAARTRIATACAEIVDNVVHHAYPGEGGEFDVRATIDRRRLELYVSDSGVGFDPLDDALDHMTDCRAGGLARIAALAEDLRIESAPGAGTKVLASFDVARAIFDEEDLVDLSELDWLPPQVTREVLTACKENPEGASSFVLSPALAVSLGRLLAGPDPRRVLRTALWS